MADKPASKTEALARTADSVGHTFAAKALWAAVAEIEAAYERGYQRGHEDGEKALAARVAELEAIVTSLRSSLLQEMQAKTDELRRAREEGRRR